MKRTTYVPAELVIRGGTVFDYIPVREGILSPGL